MRWQIERRESSLSAGFGGCLAVALFVASALIGAGTTSSSHSVLGDAARTITALLTVRDKVIAPVLAGIRTPRRGRLPENWTNIDRDYETLRLDMQTLFNDLGISTKTAPA